MIRKIKVKVITDDKKINLPGIPISLLGFFINTALLLPWSEKEDETESRLTRSMQGSENGSQKKTFNMKWRSENSMSARSALHLANDFLKQAKPLLKQTEPFTLIEVQSDDAYVLIEMR